MDCEQHGLAWQLIALILDLRARLLQYSTFRTPFESRLSRPSLFFPSAIRETDVLKRNGRHVTPTSATGLETKRIKTARHSNTKGFGFFPNLTSWIFLRSP